MIKLTVKEFVLNDLIKLKLENNKTVIYVSDEPFLHCKHLLLIGSKILSGKIESIDDIEELYSHKLETILGCTFN